MHAEDIDLLQLTERLAASVQSLPPGYLPGKTALRNAVVGLLSCSELEAERLVDTLEHRKLIVFDGDPREAPSMKAGWSVGPNGLGK